MPKIRSANACNTCKLRKLRCDEQQPICANCLRAKRYCDHATQTTFRHYGKPSSTSHDAEDPLSALKDPEVAALFHHYILHLAAWYDLSDGRASFTKVVPLFALSNALLFNAIIAFAAIHRSKTRAPSSIAIAERFHGSCVKHLIDIGAEDLDDADGQVLAAVCLLRSYELLAEDSDPNRHLSGAYALAVSSFPVPQEAGLLKAGFFNYLREDITYSLIHRCPLKLDVSDIRIPDSALDDEDQLNIASLYLANTINQVFRMANAEYLHDALEERFHHWKSSLPVQFVPYYKTEVVETALKFPTIRMLRGCHVAVLQYLLVTETLRCTNGMVNKTTAELNAIKICGLAFSADSPAVVSD